GGVEIFDPFRLAANTGTSPFTQTVVFLNSTSYGVANPYNATLPASGNSGRIFILKRVDTSASQVVNILPNGSDTIDGYSSYTMPPSDGTHSNGGFVIFIDNGSTGW